MNDPSSSFYATKAKHEYTDKTWEYLSRFGTRKDQTKEALEAETAELFKQDSEMITARDECDLFEMVLKFANAKTAIEVGVFTGSSSISIARGLGEGGKLYAFDISEEFTNVAKKYWEIEGLSDKVELFLGNTIEGLNKLIEDGKEGTIDFAYIDADKPSYLDYYELLVRLVRKGGIIAIDNVIWANRIGDYEIDDIKTTSLRAVNERVYNDPRVKNVILALADGVNLVYKL